MSDELERIAGRIRELRPGQFRRQIRGWLRASYPASSIPQGSPSAEKPMPGFDRFDKWLRGRRKARETAWKNLKKHLDELERIENSVLKVADPVPDPVEYPCANLRCDKTLELGRTSGECSKCRVHRHRFGMTWPLRQEGAA